MAAKGRTPVRRALRKDSPLLETVMDGLGAVENKHHVCFEEGIRQAFADSLDLDKALRPGRDREHRWDYLLGHAASMEVVAVEPHSAKQDQISRVIRKRLHAREQLRAHMSRPCQKLIPAEIRPLLECTDDAARQPPAAQ